MERLPTWPGSPHRCAPILPLHFHSIRGRALRLRTVWHRPALLGNRSCTASLKDHHGTPSGCTTDLTTWACALTGSLPIRIPPRRHPRPRVPAMKAARLHYSLKDPSAGEGSEAEGLALFRRGLSEGISAPVAPPIDAPRRRHRRNRCFCRGAQGRLLPTLTSEAGPAGRQGCDPLI